MARLAAAGASIVAALIIVAISIWYLGEALVLGLKTAELGPGWTMLIAGAIGLVVAALIGLVARLLVRPRPAVRPLTANDAAAQLGGLVAQQLLSTTRAHPYGTTGAALAAGLAVGAIPELRDLFKGVLKG